MTQSKSRSLWREIISFGLPLFVGLLLATVLRVVAYQPFTIPSSSMAPGLLTGDYIVVSKFAYGWSAASLPFGKPEGEERLMASSPQRGDVVVFRLPRDRKQVWIKRVIGLPGDTVEMKNGQLVINGQTVPYTALGTTFDRDNPLRPVEAFKEQLGADRAYVVYDGGPDMAGDNTAPILVPSGHYLMMGDNRDNSLDGRWSADVGIGFLPASHIIGQAKFIAWSWKPGASLVKPWTWPNLRGDRVLKTIE
ncbi:MAG: signal peptidase I [Brevundimonas sp.]